MKGYQLKDRESKKAFWGVWIVLTVLMGVLLLAAPSKEEGKMQGRIAGEVLRFRVVANSDRKDDQEEKIRVRDAVLEVLHPVLEGAENKEESRELVRGRMEEVEKAAGELVAPKSVKVSLAEDWFPERVYGECTFPEGMYDTLRIEIGEAKGHNWWCVLYPGLCFGDAVNPVVNEEGKEELRMVLDEDAYDFLLHPAKTKIRFRWF